MKVGLAIAAITLIMLVGAVGMWFWGANISLITGGTYPAPTTSSIDKFAAQLKLGDILLIKSATGDCAAIRFDRMTPDWGADYTSWHVPAASPAAPTAFQGHVFERYWHARTGMHSSRVTRIGGDYTLRCGPESFDWSASTYVYVRDGFAYAVQPGAPGALPDFGAEGLIWFGSLPPKAEQKAPPEQLP